MLISWFLKVFSHRLEPQEDQNVWSVFYTFSKYEPADISYCLKHTYNAYIHSETDTHPTHADWIVRIVLCFHCMDKCKYGQLYPFRFCIPHSTDVSIVYTWTSPSVYSVTLYLTLCGVWKIDMLYRNKNLSSFLYSFFFFFFFAQFSAQSLMEWRATHALSLTYNLHNLKQCHAVLSSNGKCFYLWSLRHITVLIFGYFLHPKLKCSCSPYAFFPCKSYCCIAIVVTCTGFYIFAPLHLLLMCSSKCLTNLKGLPLVLCSTIFEDTGYQRLRGRFIRIIWILFLTVIREEDTRGSCKHNHKEVAFSQQHSQSKGMESLVSCACFKNVVFSVLR